MERDRSESTGGDTDAGADTSHGPKALPKAVCDAPSLVDVSAPTTTVGDGTSKSCTEKALQTAASGGGNLEWPSGAGCTETPFVENPLLGALKDSGGGTETLLPAETSPTKGLGTRCPETDRRGELRSEPCTTGAVEIMD